MDQEKFKSLLHQFTIGTISTEAQEKLFSMMDDPSMNDALKEEIALSLLENGDAADLPPHISQEIVRNIFLAEKATAQIVPLHHHFRRYWIAAAVVAVLAISAYFLRPVATPVEEQFISTVLPVSRLVAENKGKAAELIILQDSSRVTLEPGSTLYYTKDLNDSAREVVLDGKAFFEVKPDPGRPFLVYSSHMVTRVLGTSFYVNTRTPEGNEEISVKTGKVQVTENLMGTQKQKHAAVIITPNQKLIYTTDFHSFETTIVDSPEPVQPNRFEKLVVAIPHYSFLYDRARLGNVFKELEATYGIEIITENSALINCEFSGNVSGEDLFTKLKIICLATQSSYSVIGTKILVSGQGCL